MHRGHKSLGVRKKIAIVCILLPLEILLVNWMKSNADWVEKYYSQGVYPFISKTLRFLTGWTSISFGSFIITALVITILYWLIRSILKLRKKHLTGWQFLGSALLNGTLVYTIIYGWFLMSWGFNYFRTPLVQKLELDTNNIEAIELKELSEELVLSCNTLRTELSEYEELPLTDEQIRNSAYKGYDGLYESFNVPALEFQSIKSPLFSDLFSYLSISGIYSMITGEALVNAGPPNFHMPFTATHEIAHQIGFGSEQEANFLAYLACENHPDPSFRYSGSIRALRYTMRALYWADSSSYNTLSETVLPQVKDDMRVVSEYWGKYDNPFEVVSDWIYDRYLKANAQSAGIRSYGLMVRLLIGNERKKKQKSPELLNDL